MKNKINQTIRDAAKGELREIHSTKYIRNEKSQVNLNFNLKKLGEKKKSKSKRIIGTEINSTENKKTIF